MISLWDQLSAKLKRRASSGGTGWRTNNWLVEALLKSEVRSADRQNRFNRHKMRAGEWTPPVKLCILCLVYAPWLIIELNLLSIAHWRSNNSIYWLNGRCYFISSVFVILMDKQLFSSIDVELNVTPKKYYFCSTHSMLRFSQKYLKCCLSIFVICSLVHEFCCARFFLNRWKWV